MSSKGAPLNAEPAGTAERAQQHLPPKSYADAVYQNGVNGTNGTLAAASPHGSSGLPGTDDRKVVFEKHVNASGEQITSVKPQEGYEESLKHNKATTLGKEENGEKKQDESLASGRQAGKGWEKSAIRWAPMNVPLQRRLQTVAVLWHTTTIAVCLTIFFFLCSIPLLWPLLIPYLVHALVFDNTATNGRLKRRSDFLRRSKFWSLFASYFPARLHRTVELPPTRKYIFGYHPHGIISHGAFAAFSTEALGFSDLFPGITNTLLTLDSNFRVPVYRDYALAMGLASVSRESIQNILSKGGMNRQGMGRAVTIVIGGARESLESKPHTLRLLLKTRKGFVKEAIRMGADLVPVLAFGENDLYDQVSSEEHPFIHKFQLLVKKFVGFTIPLFHARGVFNYDVGLMPYRRTVNIVVGRPIQVIQQGGPEGQVDPAYLDEIHEKYVKELIRVWDAHKDTFAQDRESELQIIG